MKDMPTPYDKIEQYLLGRLPRDEHTDMERAIREDPALAEAVELRRLEFDTARELIAEDIRAIFERLEAEEKNEKPAPGGRPKWPGSRRLWYYLAAAAVLAPLAFLTYRALFPAGPGPLDLKTTSRPASQNGASDGSIDLAVSGGSPGYTYLWSNGQKSEDLAGLSAGAYTVTVTDAGGNTAAATEVVTQPAQVANAPNQQPPDTPRQKDGTPVKPPPLRKEKPAGNQAYLALAENVYAGSRWNSLGAGARAGDPARRNPATLAAEAIERRDYAAALEHLKNAGPDDAQAQLLRAHVYFKLRRFDDAAAAVRGVAVAQNPPYGEEAEILLLLSLAAGGKENTDEFRSLSEKIEKDQGHQYFNKIAALLDGMEGKQNAPVAQADPANFAPNATMEAFVRGGARSESITVKIESPANDARFVPDQNGEVLVRFAGTVVGTSVGALNLQLYDNKSNVGKPLHSTPITLKKDDRNGESAFDLQVQPKLAEGLYYFMIWQGGEIVKGGRFVVRR